MSNLGWDDPGNEPAKPEPDPDYQYDCMRQLRMERRDAEAQAIADRALKKAGEMQPTKEASYDL